MDNQIFYPSMLKCFSECPLKYKLKYIDNLSMPQNTSSAQKGKKIHALANFYLKGQDISKLENALNYEEKAIFEKLKQNAYFQKEYIQSEYNLTAKINGYWISGRLDALMKDAENYYILDYKTGSVPKNPEYDFQTMLYLIILNKYLNKSNLNFIYIDLKNDKNYEIKLNDKLTSEYEKIITDTCRNISECSTHTAKKDKRCEYCEYRKICDYFVDL